MKRILIGVLLVLAAFGIYVGAKRGVDEYRAYQAAKLSAAYLFTPQDAVKGKDGQSLTRAQILDAIMADVVARQQAATK